MPGCVAIVFDVVLGMTHPGIELHRLPGSIHRPIRDGVGFGLVVFVIVILAAPDAAETEVREPTIRSRRGDDPLPAFVVGHRVLSTREDLAVLVAGLGKLRGLNDVPSSPDDSLTPLLRVAKKINRGLRDGRAVAGVSDE